LLQRILYLFLAEVLIKESPLGAKKVKVIKPVVKRGVNLPPESQAERIKEWADKNYALIVGALALVLFVLLAAWGIGTYERSKQTSAQSDFAVLAMKLPVEGKATQVEWEKLIPDLQKFVSDHKGTRAALNAQVELAKAFFEAKRFDDSIKTASEALKSVPSGEGLKPLLNYQLAFAYEASGMLDQAAGEWTKLKDSGLMGIEREAYWNLGRISAVKKDYPKAVEMYQKASQVSGDYPPSVLLDQELTRAKSQTGAQAQPAQ
jgi:predicted negative regulator of RcsB-dependent stress response